MPRPTVVIADDNFTIRVGYLEPMLEEHFEVVASVGDGNEAVAAALEQKPCVVLLDVSMPGLNGFQAARKILAARLDCKIIFVSNHPDPVYVEEALKLGAAGYVFKGKINGELVTAIRVALDGGFYDPRAVGSFVETD